MMMSRYRFIIQFLLTGYSLLFIGQCANVADKAFHFEVELIDRIVKALVPDYVNPNNGPKLTEDIEIHEKLCVAAVNYISFEFKDTNAAGMGHNSLWLGRPKYADVEDAEKKFYYYLRCETSPRIINVRAADSSENKYIIMVEGLTKGAHGFDGMDHRGYIFTVPMMAAAHLLSAGDELEKDDVLSRIENEDLRKKYEEMNFMDWMLLCLNAKDYIAENFPDAKPVTLHSPIGYRLLRFYNTITTDGYEEYIGYRCPTRPLLYTHLESQTAAVGIMVVIE